MDRKKLQTGVLSFFNYNLLSGDGSALITCCNNFFVSVLQKHLRAKLFVKPQKKDFKVFLISLLFVISPVSIAQKLPEPAQPRPEPTITQPESSEEEIPDVELLPLGGAAPPGASKVFTKFQGIRFQGLTQYSEEELKQYFQQYLGKKISLTQVFVIAEKIQQRFRDDGYILTRVIVPEQKVNNGVFKIQVVEGFINKIKIEGDIGPVEARVKATLENLLNRQPVTELELERHLLLVNDLPGIRAVGFLRANNKGDLGGSELVIQAERKAFEGYAYVNNRGSKYTGPYRFVLMARENSATFLGEQIEGLFLHSLFDDEQRFGQLTIRQPLNSEGLLLEMSAGFGPSRPGFGLELIDTETEALTVNAQLSYPLIRSRKHNLYVEGGFQSIDQEVRILDEKITRDQLRVFFANLLYDFKDDLGGQSQISFGIRQGIDVFDASDRRDPFLSRAEGRSDFTSLNVFFSRHQNLWKNLSLFVSGIGQYSFDTLLSPEEFTLGGERFGRGYNPAELAGDSGLGISTELQYTLPGPFEFWQTIQAYGFHDYGVVWNRDQGEKNHESLASAGLGFRNQLFEQVFIDLEVAWPLTLKPDTYDKEPRFYFQVLTRF